MTTPVAVGWGALSCVVGQEPGGLLWNADDWTITGTGYTADPDAKYMISNAISSFCGAGAKRLWVAYNVDGICANAITAYLAGLGHTITYGADSPLTTLSVASYDFAILYGTARLVGATEALRCTNIWNFINSGGGGYIHTNGIDGVSQDHSTLRSKCGVTKPASVWPPSLHIAPVSSHPIFSGVATVYMSGPDAFGTGTPLSGSVVAVHGDGGDTPTQPRWCIWRP